MSSSMSPAAVLDYNFSLSYVRRSSPWPRSGTGRPMPPTSAGLCFTKYCSTQASGAFLDKYRWTRVGAITDQGVERALGD
eukprot:3760190-Alexandrium_andersonii.AAC.1